MGSKIDPLESEHDQINSLTWNIILCYVSLALNRVHTLYPFVKVHVLASTAFTAVGA